MEIEEKVIGERLMRRGNTRVVFVIGFLCGIFVGVIITCFICCFDTPTVNGNSKENFESSERW